MSSIFGTVHYFVVPDFGISGVVYTVDHEAVPRPCKIYDWLLISSWDHFSLHQEKNVRVTMTFEAPKRHIFRPTLSTDMVQQVLRWERQKRFSSRKRQSPSHKTFVIMNFSLGKRRWRQEKTKKWSNLIFFSFQNCHFWCMVIPLGAHLVYT